MNKRVAVDGYAVAAHEVVAKAAIRAQRDLHVRGEKLHLKVHPLTQSNLKRPCLRQLYGCLEALHFGYGE